MSAWWTLVAAGLGGGALGALNAAGLWWSVRRVSRADRPGAWLLMSFVVRLALTGAGLWALSGGRADRLVAAAAGFLVVRLVVVRTVARAPAGGEGGTA